MSFSNKFKEIVSMIDFGGLNLPLITIEDKITNNKNAEQYQYMVLKNAYPGDYPRLLSDLFRLRTGQGLNLEEPKSFNEKIQWMKLYDSTALKTRLADKYLVRDWISEKIGEQYLVPLLGVWDSFDEIDFDSLPDAFALKCNHGSGMNVIIADKAGFCYEAKLRAKKEFDKWLDYNFAFRGLELQYRDISRKIIAEQYITQIDDNLLDYKIHVFGGKPKIIQVIGNRKKDTVNECFFTPDWVQQDLMYHTYNSYDIVPDRPKELDEMLEIASKLGAGFRYVRVDLYNIEGRIIFGEMTFTPASGFGKWVGDSQYLVGSWINLK